MDLKGSRQIAADRQTVWEALNDPEVLKACIPGCQELTGSPQDGFEATVKQKVGPVSATFRGAVSLSNVKPGESYTISGEGKGGAAGFAKGGADVRLEDGESGGTLLSYDVKASVGGKLAQLGSRVIDGFSKKMADQFFDDFQRMVGSPEAGAEAGGFRPAEEAGAGTGAAASRAKPAAKPVAPKTGAPRKAPATPTGGAAGAAASGEEPSVWKRIAAWFRRLINRT